MLFCVLLHRIGQVGYAVGPEAIYMGGDCLSAVVAMQATYGPDARCLTLWWTSEGGKLQDPIRVFVP